MSLTDLTLAARLLLGERPLPLPIAAPPLALAAAPTVRVRFRGAVDNEDVLDFADLCQLLRTTRHV